MDETTKLKIDENDTPTISINSNKKNKINNILKDEEYEEIDNRNCFQKIFGKMGPGSLRGCIFNLCILSLGTGCFAMPQKIGYLSILIFIIVLLIIGILNYWTLNILGDAYKKYNINNYELLITKFYNKKICLFLSIIIFLNQIGLIILYQVILYKLLGGIINESCNLKYENAEIFAHKSFWSEFKIRFFICYLITVIILFPLCKLKNISKMRYASSFGIFSLILVIIIVVIQSPFFIKKNIFEKNQKINLYHPYPIFDKKNMEFLKSISTILYSFSCHQGVFPVLESLHNPTKKRIKKIFLSVILLCVICYLIIGIFGYLSQPFNTPDLIIERKKIFDNDIVMTFAQLLFIFCLIAKICANYNTLRSTVLVMFKYDNKNYSDKLNIKITIICLGFSTFIAVVFQNISDCISLIGSFCSVWITILFPLLIYIKMNEKLLKNWEKFLLIILFLFVIYFGIITSYYSVIGMID